MSPRRHNALRRRERPGGGPAVASCQQIATGDRDHRERRMTATITPKIERKPVSHDESARDTGSGGCALRAEHRLCPRRRSGRRPRHARSRGSVLSPHMPVATAFRATASRAACAASTRSSACVRLPRGRSGGSRSRTSLGGLTSSTRPTASTSPPRPGVGGCRRRHALRWTGRRNARHAAVPGRAPLLLHANVSVRAAIEVAWQDPNTGRWIHGTDWVNDMTIQHYGGVRLPDSGGMGYGRVGTALLQRNSPRC